MNIILFDSQEIQTALPLTDVRSVHITDILKRQIGEEFDVGLLNGPRGKASIVSQSEAGLNLKFVWGQMPQALDPITLVIGMPRPQTARKILSEAAALGVKTLYFVSTENKLEAVLNKLFVLDYQKLFLISL